MKGLMLAGLLSIANSVAYAGQNGVGQYHFREIGLMGCADRAIAAEISDANRHPGMLSDSAYERAAKQGRCLPWSPDVSFKVLRFETFAVMEGKVTVAYSVFEKEGSAPIYFYAATDDIIRVK